MAKKNKKKWKPNWRKVLQAPPKPRLTVNEKP